MKTTLKAAVAGTVISLCALALGTGTAAAAIVCNADGDCWHVRDAYTYPDTARVVVHEDNWAWKENDHYRWREHEGRGYWNGGVWVAF